MKIVLLGTAWPYRGGLASFNERLIRAFTEEGHDAEIVTFTLQYPQFLFPGKTQFSTSPAPTDLRISRAINSISPFNWWKLGKQIRKQRPDMVIIKYWTPMMAPCFGTIAASIRRNGHTKVLCIADNIVPHEQKFTDTILTRYFVNRVDGFVAMSNNVLQDLVRFDRKKIRALNPHPLFDNFGQAVSKQEACAFLHLDPNRQYMLFFGFIRDYKGLDLLLEAMQKVNSACELIIAGEFYTDRAVYDKLIAQSRHKERIHRFHNFIADEDVKYFFCAADAVVQPYKHATQSGVTQIAYHFEVPMIVTNTGGLSEMVPNDIVGYVTEPDPQQLANAIDRIGSQEIQQRFRDNIQEEKKRFSWSRMTKTLLDMYARIR